MSFELQQNVGLAEFTTFKIGGKARFFVEAKSENEVVEALKFADENALKVFILGGGSNVLIADKGFDGLVIKIAVTGITILPEDNETVFVTIGAGENWDELVALCVRENLQGFECLSGIPGLVGGTPVQNVGAYGQEVSETIRSVKILERATGKISEITNADCAFEYRTSIFNTTKKDCFIVLAVKFALKINGEPKIVYKDLREFFGERRPSLSETREAVLKIRRAKSMVIDPEDSNSKSAGSFFKNPIVNREKFAEICDKFGNLIPGFPVDENTVKIPAAWLIEHSGFQKGYRNQNAGISAKHTLAIVNLGNATAREICDLKNFIQEKVFEHFEIMLTPEPIFVGFDQ